MSFKYEEYYSAPSPIKSGVDRVFALSTIPFELLNMEIKTLTVEEVTLVELAGEVDANTVPMVQEKVLPLALPSTKIIIDLTKVSYMSSAGLRILLTLYRQTYAQDGKLVLVGLSSEIQDIMSVTGFLDFFTTCETLESGLKVLK
nr:anti-sigma factor antagonist [Iningainema tapete]